MVNRLTRIIRTVRPKPKRTLRPPVVGKPSQQRAVVLRKGGLQSVGSREQQAGAIFRTPTKKKSSSKSFKPLPSKKSKGGGSSRPSDGFVTLPDKQTSKLGELSSRIQEQRGILRTKKIRGKLGAFEELSLAAFTAGSSVVDFSKGVIDLPGNVVRIIKNPSILKGIPAAVERGGAEFGQLIRVSPTEAFVRIGTELVLIKGSASALNKVGKIAEVTTARLSPSFVGAAKTGKILKIKTGKAAPVELRVVGKIPGQTVKKQVEIAGRTIPKAISSQADSLLGIIRNRKKTLRKPIPGEADFSPLTKKLLSKFDSGKISKRELISLDTLVKKQGAKGLLERSFFADPSGRIRPSRLGVEQKKPSLIDILSGDVTFKKPKPQILLFEDIKVSKFPKSLNNVAKKLKQGRQLTAKESNALLEFQLRKSGKFKPLGFVSKESEILLAPTEILKRVKKVGTTIVKGRKVPIIKTEIFKPTGKTKNLLNKFKKNKLTKAEAKQLDKLLKKQTGFDYGVKGSSSAAASKKFVSIKRVGLSSLASLSKSASKKAVSPRSVSKISRLRKSTSKKFSKRSVSRPSSKASPRKSITSRSPILGRSPKSTISPKSPPKKSPPRKPPRSPPRPGKTPKKPLVPIPRLSSRRRRFKKKGTKEGFIIKEKQGGKFKRLKGKPLSKQDAKDRLATFLENRISRTAKIVSVGKVKKLGKITKRERGQFRKTRRNLREFKIVKGRRVRTPNTFIERKGKGVINTPGEKAQLRLNRIAKAGRKSNGRFKKGKR